MLRRAVQHAQLLDAPVAQMPHHLLARRARADDQRAVGVQLAENTLGQFHSGRTPRKPAARRVPFPLRTRLPDFESALEHAVEDGSGFAVIESDLVGVAHLSQNFRFAEQHRIEPRGNAEQMAHGMAVPVPVERAVQFVERKLMEGREEQFHCAGAVCRILARHAVQFAAIARRKDQRFLEDSSRTQAVRRLPAPARRESEALAQIDRGRAVIQSDENDFHLQKRPPDFPDSLLAHPLRNTGENAKDIASRYCN